MQKAVSSRGEPKIVPKVLAQHHCSPPPTEEAMAQWLNELRKRHAKQYASMQLQRRESQLYKERVEGYKGSVQSDVTRQIQEQKEEQERIAKEKAEQERLEALEKRRAELLESLPEEPDKTVKDAFTIALRFSDGRSGRRRFASDTPLSTIFNWVDASYSIERELVVLTTMNGKLSFSWEETQTLQESGLTRNTGLRVTQKKEEEKPEADDKETPGTDDKPKES